MKLVIIGGGFCGSLCAKKLENKFEAVLIDKNDYFEFIPAVPRVLVKEKDIPKIRVCHSNYLKNTKILLGEVNKINNKFVLVKKDKKYEKINYDYLIIAAGSRYAPFKANNALAATRSSDLKKYSEKINKAGEILIIGGGLVGVEMAAELVTKTNKKVTIVHANDRLIERNSLKASEYAKKFLESRGCKIILNERIRKPKEGEKTFFTESEDKIKGDFAFICTGIKSNADLIGFYKKNKIDKKGYLTVNDYLQVEENIFAGGDIASINEEKTAQNSRRNAKFICNNIIRKIKDKEMLKYKTKSTPLVISLGAYDGIFSYNNFLLKGKIPALMKYLIEKIILLEYKIKGFLI